MRASAAGSSSGEPWRTQVAACRAEDWLAASLLAVDRILPPIPFWNDVLAH